MGLLKPVLQCLQDAEKSKFNKGCNKYMID